jgi:hypothetical protein
MDFGGSGWGAGWFAPGRLRCVRQLDERDSYLVVVRVVIVGGIDVWPLAEGVLEKLLRVWVVRRGEGVDGAKITRRDVGSVRNLTTLEAA